MPKSDTQFKPGESGNPNGRPKGSRNFETLYKESMTKIAKSKDMTLEELEEEIMAVGVTKALEGDATFYRDLLDRKHGKAKQDIGVDANINGVIQVVSKVPDAEN